MTSGRVLAVECDWRVRALIRANLEAAGIEVCEAVSGHHGLRMLEQCRPDLVLLSLDLPDMDAAQFLARAMLALSGDPVRVLVTCDEPPDHRLHALSGAVGHLKKPFGAPLLLDTVRGALGEASAKP